MMNRKVVSTLILLILAGSVALYFYPDRALFLLAKSVVPVYETESDAMLTPAPLTIASISPEERVRVLRCVDVKHYLIYKVRLRDGRTGFVNTGEYILMKDGKPSHC